MKPPSAGVRVSVSGIIVSGVFKGVEAWGDASLNPWQAVTDLNFVQKRINMH